LHLIVFDGMHDLEKIMFTVKKCFSTYWWRIAPSFALFRIKFFCRNDATFNNGGIFLFLDFKYLLLL
jgi:hypothetical protein